MNGISKFTKLYSARKAQKIIFSAIWHLKSEVINGVGPRQVFDIMYFICEIWPVLGLKEMFLASKREKRSCVPPYYLNSS